MNVWLITIGEALPVQEGARKLRTAIVAEGLVARGHNVLWWTSAFDHFKKEFIFDKDTEIDLGKAYHLRALKGMAYRRNISLARFIDHRIIALKFRRKAQSVIPPDIIVVASPSYDLAREAVVYAKKRGIPVIVDIRDQWPDIFLDRIPPCLHSTAKILLAREFFLFKQAVSGADSLIAMMDSLLTWGLSYAGRPRRTEDRVFYLGYRRKKMNGTPSEQLFSILPLLKDKFVVTFIGTFAYYHNPEILLEAAKKLLGEKIHFVIAGDGAFMSRIGEKAKALPNVSLPGWLKQNDIDILMAHSHVGVSPTPQDALFFPNKVFVYLAAGLPIISAFKGDLWQFINSHEIGFNYAPRDVEALTNIIHRLSSSPELYSKTATRVKKVFDEYLDADKIYTDYMNHIEEIATNHSLIKQ
ncbi:MAG: glycosyltransferase family 4 protein [Thermodesulfovibrionales bacterium]|nr:glycosyltransferase family 4 protein [Thermodesulfovibrionales bacterium]